MKRIIIGVSSCLLGHKVRYDGNDKRNSIIENDICARFRCVPLCPEYAIGLGVPRDPLHIIQFAESRRVVRVADQSVDVTAQLQQYADFVCGAWAQICGYIFKARSPSCGLVDTPVFDFLGNEINKGPGGYTAQILRRLGTLPVIDELQLADPVRRRDFVQKVERYSQSSKR